MAKVTYIEYDGTERLVEVDNGMSVMDGAVWNRVCGVLASCGGEGGCATCHVYVDEAWRARVGEKSSKERGTLRFALKVQDNSRLSCFIKVTDDLNGLIVRIPERQF